MSNDAHATLFTDGKKLLITTRGDNYKNKANGVGYSGWKRQVHHVLPCASLNKSKEAFIDDQAEPDPARLGIERIVDYNVNRKENLMGLPSSKVYAKKYCRPFSVMPRPATVLAAVADPLVAGCDWPIHLWNHPAFNSHAQLLTDAVWDELGLKIEEHKPVQAKNLGQALQNISNQLRTGIENPAKKALRTQAAWQSGNKAAFDIY